MSAYADEAVAATTAMLSCGSADETGIQLGQRLEQSLATRDGLTTFLAGESLGAIPAASLFVVDLADENAIQRRVSELQGLQQAPAAAMEKAGAILNCSRQFLLLAGQGASLAELQGGINRLRLGFSADRGS